ncbi:MAG: DinB family protein [Actinobacteria bacterium]|nr:DinB family protein [Actinomycetota bacterium]
MPHIDDQGRPEPPVAANEADTLLGYLDFQRATLEWKTRGLDEAGLRRTIASSSMTLAGLLKHMAYVEDHWFSGMLLDLPRMSPWDAVDWAATPDWEWESAAREPATAVRAQWKTSVERSRAVVRDALSRAGVSGATTASGANVADPLGLLAKRSWPNGERPSLRWILVHMIEEYARHNGHADLLREVVDGETGE